MDVPHHVTQRGNARQVILGEDTDRNTYLRLLQQHSELHGLSLLGYCLMSNHVHLVAIPHTTDALGQALKQAVRGVLECTPVFERTRLAGAVLFLSAR